MNDWFETVHMLAPAFLAGAIISLAHVPLGQEVLRRGIVFLDLAIAQCAALGIIAFHVFLSFEEDGAIATYGALGAGLVSAFLCAFLFYALERRTGRFQEALIGCAFVLFASLSLLLMSKDPHGGEEIKDILSGQILWVDWSEILFAGPVFGIVLAVWLASGQKREKLFYPLFALVIPFSVQIMGVYLVFASLVFPALAVARLSRGKILAGIGLSAASHFSGLATSYALDWPSGPAIVLSMGATSAFFALAVRNSSRP